MGEIKSLTASVFPERRLGKILAQVQGLQLPAGVAVEGPHQEHERSHFSRVKKKPEGTARELPSLPSLDFKSLEVLNDAEDAESPKIRPKRTRQQEMAAHRERMRQARAQRNPKRPQRSRSNSRSRTVDAKNAPDAGSRREGASRKRTRPGQGQGSSRSRRGQRQREGKHPLPRADTSSKLPPAKVSCIACFRKVGCWLTCCPVHSFVRVRIKLIPLRALIRRKGTYSLSFHVA